jgi:hypothetical protein
VTDDGATLALERTSRPYMREKNGSLLLMLLPLAEAEARLLLPVASLSSNDMANTPAKLSLSWAQTEVSNRRQRTSAKITLFATGSSGRQ